MYVKDQPRAKVYRNRTLMNFNDLCLIYVCTQADGRYIRSSHGVGSTIPAESAECPKTEWTMAMDQYFIERMLDILERAIQARPVAHTYRKKKMLNYQDLRMIYGNASNNGVSSLMHQGGNSGPKIFQHGLVSFVSVNTWCQSYHNRTLPSYNDLFLICGNTSIDWWLLEAENYADEEEDESPSSSSPARIHTKGMVGIKPEIDNHTLDMGFNDIFGDLQSLPAEFEIPDQRKRRQTDTSSMSTSRKAPKSNREILHAFDEKPLTVKTSFSNEDKYYRLN